MSAHTPDIVIVGGGLVGLSFAAALRSLPWSVVVVDAAPRQGTFRREPPSVSGASLSSGVDARVSAINPASCEFLERVGGWPTGGEACAFTHMSVRDSRGSGSIDFDAGDSRESALGYIIENRTILRTLTETLEQSDVELLDGRKIDAIESTDSRYRLLLADGDSVECRLLVGADGGNSIVRKACGIRSLRWRYPQQAMVTTIRTGKPHGATARQWFTAEGPLAFLPLASEDERLCSIVWSSTSVERLLELDDARLCDRLTHASESELGAVEAVDQRFSFPLRQSQAFQYVRAQLALIGDAAHTIHPLAGQGANLGLADARALSAVLADAHYAGDGIGEPAVLRRYQRRRQPVNVATAALMEAFARLYQSENAAINWIRNAGTRFVDGQGLVKSLLVRAASGR